MKANMLKKIYSDEINTIYYIDEKSFREFLKANDITDKLGLIPELFVLDHVLVLDTAANEPEWAVVGIDSNGTQTYEFDYDDNGDLVLCYSTGLWGPHFKSFLNKIIQTYSDES